MNEQEKNDELGVYELGYHVVSSTPQEELAAVVTGIKEEIGKLGGVFISEEFPQTMRLAYTIVRKTSGGSEKHDMAHFGSIKFEMEPAQTSALTGNLEQNEHILRFILIRTVREDTRAPRRAASSHADKKGGVVEPEEKVEARTKTEEPKKPVSEEELDRTIEELMVE